MTPPAPTPTDNDAQPSSTRKTISELPDETLAFASRVFDKARSSDTQTLSAYLDAGLPANLTNDKGNTLLMLAAYNGHAALVRVLHSKGADINRLNDRQQSPLAGAIFKNETEVVQTLIELGADPRAGQPSAIDAARIFNQTQWFDPLGATEEERKGRDQAGGASS